MNCTDATQASLAIVAVDGTCTSDSIGAMPSLLPLPSEISADVEDVVAELLRLSSSLSDEQLRIGKTQIASSDVQQRGAAQARRDALESAAEATRKAEEAAKKGGFFSFFTDNLALIGLTVVAAAATVATLGGAGPGAVALVGIGISLSTEVASRTGLLEAAVGGEAAGWVAFGGALIGAACTIGASAAGTLSTLEKTAHLVNAGATVAQGTCMTYEAVKDSERANYQRDADHANIDATQHKQVLDRIQKLLHGILEDIREAKDSSRRVAESLNGTLQIDNQTMLQAGALKV